MLVGEEIVIKILDCTIRDGGHLNKWHFSPLCVKSSYFAALKCGVDYFEIGYRFPLSMKGLGDFGYCTDEFLFSLFNATEKCKLTVMIDAGKTDSDLFCECVSEKTQVKAVRVAAYPYDLEKAICLLEVLKSKGYEIFLNLMASSELTEKEFKILNDWQHKDILEAIVFADSFGSFIPSDIPFHVNRIKDIGFNSIGFHPHNNLQMSFANTLRAIEEGVTFVDASIFGMGRGSGNLPIEVLIGYLEKRGNTNYNTVPYLDVIERFYLKLFERHDWGYKVPSLMGGLKNIHPYYIDELFKRKIYTIDEIWNALDMIKEKCPISYSVEKLNQTLDKRFYTPLTMEKVEKVYSEIGDQLKIIPATDGFKVNGFEIKNKHVGRKFIVIANGPSIIRYKDEINNFINDESLVTIGVNYLDDNYIPDYHLFVSKKRFLKYATSVKKNSVVMVPSYFGKNIVKEIISSKCIYFDLETVDEESECPIVGSTQKLVNLNVSVAAILSAYMMGAAEIYGVGMDGYIDEKDKQIVYFYDEHDKIDDKIIASMRYEKMATELERVNSFLQDNSVPFSIITPTSHKKYYRPIIYNNEL